MSNRAWVTLATNDSYGLGALVLAHSLRRADSAYPAVVLITPSVTEAMRDRLSAVFAEVVVVDVLDSGDAAHLALLQRPELGITFTKIHCWNLTQYEKCVFLDADTLVVQNCDELFEREELSAAPDVGWPDCFNSGVFVYKPSAETFAALIEFAQQRGSFDGGDQGLLNSYFSDWAHGDINKHLPFLYNVTSAAFYSYLPALKHYGRDLKIIHFIGAAKPWLQNFDWRSRQVQSPEHLRELLQLWWDLFVAQVHSQLDPSMSGVAGNLARVTPDAVGASEAIDELTRRQGWEAGNIDYMGADSFDNIWAKISQTLSQPPVSPPEQPTPPPEEPAPPKEPEQPAPAKETEQPAPATEAVQPAPVKESEQLAPATEPEQPTPAKESKQSAEKPEPPVAPKSVEEPQVAAVEAKQSEAAPTATEVSSETAAPVDATPVEAPAKSEASAPSEIAPKVAEPLVGEAASPVGASPVATTVEATISKEPTPAEVISQPVSSEEASVPVETADIPIEASTPVDIPVPVVEAVLAQAAEPSSAPVAPEEIPAPVLEVSAAIETPKKEAAPAPVADVEAAKEEPPKKETPAEAVTAPAVEAEAPPSVKPEEKPAKPEDVPVATATDSPPLANTPSTEVPADPAAKSEERRRPAGKLQLRPPLAADPLPTPDSELEDAASLAQSIIASELRTPTVTAPSPVSPAPPAPRQEKRLSVEGPQIPTPPVSLTQIGVKPAKGKATTAARIESSVAEQPAPEPKADAPKKKVVKKVLKKESSGEAPVPPPRKKEKKPKEK